MPKKPSRKAPAKRRSASNPRTRTPVFSARDIKHIRRTADELRQQQDEDTYDGPEVIMTSLGYVEVYPEDGDSASVTMHGVNWTIEELVREVSRRLALARLGERRSAKNGGPLKRTKRACSMRGKQTRAGSSKAASRLSTHCPRRAAKNGRGAARVPNVGDAIHYYLIPFGFAPTDGPHEATVERVYWNPSSQETLVDARLLGVHAGSMARSIPYHGSPSAIPSGEGRYRWWAWPSDAKKFARKPAKRRSAKNCGR